jgi:NADPH-dependent glutamate synthase beta subunit-like oxidoreductase
MAAAEHEGVERFFLSDPVGINVNKDGRVTHIDHKKWNSGNRM